MHQVDIRRQGGFPVAAIEHRGEYMNIGRAFERLFHWLSVRGLVDPKACSLGVYFDDPSAVAADLRSMACCELFAPDAVNFEAPVKHAKIAGGEFAVLTHVSGRMRSFASRISGCTANGCQSRGVKPAMRRCSRCI